MSYRNRRTDNSNYHDCRECGTRVYWRDGAYCGACQTLPSRHCFECNRDNLTAGRVCHGCDAALPLAPVFGFDRVQNAWDSRDPASLAEQRYRKWIAGAKGDPSITLATCDGCELPFDYRKDKRGLLGANGRHPDIREYRRPLHEVDADWQAADPRYTYGGKAHRECVNPITGDLIRVAVVKP